MFLRLFMYCFIVDLLFKLYERIEVPFQYVVQGVDLGASDAQFCALSDELFP